MLVAVPHDSSPPLEQTAFPNSIIPPFSPDHSLSLSAKSCSIPEPQREKMQEQATNSLAASSLPSSSERSSSSAPHHELKEGDLSPGIEYADAEGLESDDELRRVPEMIGDATGNSAGGRDRSSVAGPERALVLAEGQRRRGRSPADKENKRLKRLLRNRVSAQQARERKKAYLNDLEVRVKDLEKKNSELMEKVSTLLNENQMLRQILKNTTGSGRGGNGSSNADG